MSCGFRLNWVLWFIGFVGCYWWFCVFALDVGVR